ncbi:MAG: hypothetical protein U0946_00780 [Patescibacteria group bacterium]|nr:hypothetical protein [Patescibacteria group bacterium]
MAVSIGDYFNLGDPAGGGALKKISNVTEYNADGLFSLISVILRNIYVLAAIILFVMIFLGGLGMIISAGDAEKQKQSSKTLGSAVTGFAILFLSYWILKLIQFLTGIQLIYFLP